MEGAALQLENRTQVIVWLRENYKHATTTSVSKRSVFAHYLDVCRKQSVLTPISHTYFGKLVRKAFPDVRCNRKGPRGSAQQHYRLIRVDGGSSDIPDDLVFDDEEDVEYKRPKMVKSKMNKKKAAAPSSRKSSSSRVRAAATAAASTISRIVSADKAPANLAEAWSFSSAPSSPSYSMPGGQSNPSSPAQSYAEDDEEYVDELPDAEAPQQESKQEEYEEEEEEEQVEEEEEEVEEDEAEEQEEEEEEEQEQEEEQETEEAISLDFDQLPKFELCPGDESPGTSFSYEAIPRVSGEQQNMMLQQQLQRSHSFPATSFGAVPQQPAAAAISSIETFYDFVSPDLEMPLSAINQVNLAEDLGWNWTMPSVAFGQPQQAAASSYGQPQQYYRQPQQSAPLHSYLLADQLSSAQCADLTEWVQHYC